VDEDYPARPEIKQSLTGWGDNCGSESCTLETDVCVWRYAPLVVHATQEEEDVEKKRVERLGELSPYFDSPQPRSSNFWPQEADATLPCYQSCPQSFTTKTQLPDTTLFWPLAMLPSPLLYLTSCTQWPGDYWFPAISRFSRYRGSMYTLSTNHYSLPHVHLARQLASAIICPPFVCEQHEPIHRLSRLSCMAMFWL